MLSSTQAVRFIGLLSLLTILNVTFLGFSWRRKEHLYPCSVDFVLEGITRYIHEMGLRPIEDVMTEQCIKSIANKETKDGMEAAIRSLVTRCRRKNETRPSTVTRSKPLVTLFTTWPQSNNSDKVQIHERTLQNWQRLQPKVDIVVFTNSSDGAKLGKEHNASVYRILEHEGGGAPVLRWMFETVKKHHPSSHFYGYVNSDILFTNSLIKTLESVLDSKKPKVPLFIVGRRTNVKNITFNETKTFEDIENVAKQRGELFYPNAEDFFITNAAFPWSKIIDVVVGRLAYDNWIVGHVICSRIADVIEITDTTTAVHQTTESGGNYEGFKSAHSHYNNDMFKKLGIKPKFESGFTICAPEYTFINLCNDVQLQRRSSFWSKCACPTKTPPAAKTSPVLYKV